MIQIAARIEEIATASLAVEQALRKAKVSDEDRMRALLTLEEVLVQLIEHAEPDSVISVRMSRSLYSRAIKISCRGRQIDLQQMMNVDGLDLDAGLMAPEAEDYVREIILRGQSERLSASYKKGVNQISLTVSRTQQAMLINIGISIALGLVAGLLTRFLCTPEILQSITANCFSPLYSLFLKAIQMVMAPLIFFSLAYSLCGLSDMRSLGRIGGKVMGTYTITTLLAMLVALGIAVLLHPGEYGCMAGVFAPNEEASTDSISLMNVILDIVPDSFVAPFVTTNVMQVLFLAICFGLVTANLGQYSQPVTTFLGSLNELFNRFTSAIAKFLPLAVFGSMAAMTSTIDVSSIWMVLSWLSTMVLSLCIMYVLYGVLLLLRGFNPLHFYRTFFDATMMAFSTCASAATISTSMRCCENMGVQKRVYSFSIPLGATINMDGSCIFYIISTFFLANVCGVTIEPSMMASLFLTIMLMSFAAPGVPGAGLACQLMLLNMVGVPTASMALILAVDPLIDPFITALNVTGDGAVTTMVDASEKEKHL